jgi:hypothetical protein
MKAVRVHTAKFTPNVDMGCTQVICDLLLLLHVHGPTSPLSLPGRRMATRVNKLGLHTLPCCRTATFSCGLPCLTSTARRLPLNLINLPLLGLKGVEIIGNRNPVVTVLSGIRV